MSSLKAFAIKNFKAFFLNFMRAASVLGLLVLQVMMFTSAMASQQKTSFHEVLSWLPADTESVAVTNGPFALPVSKNLINNLGLAQPSETIPLLAIFPLTEFEAQRFYPALAGHTVELAVEALGRFPKRPDPTNLTRGIYIILFEDKNSWPTTYKDVRKRSISSTKYKGIEVISFREPVDYADPKNHSSIELYVSSPKLGVLVISSNLSEIYAVIDRLGQKNCKQLALPSTLPEWKFVDETARCWALRHYDKESEDPLMPSGGVGFTMSYRPESKFVEVTLLSLDHKTEFSSGILRKVMQFFCQRERSKTGYHQSSSGNSKFQGSRISHSSFHAARPLDPSRVLTLTSI